MDRGLLTEESADGHVITYMRVSYEGEGPFHESTRPIALGMDDGTPQPPGPSHEQVAERLVRQANYGLHLLTETTCRSVRGSSSSRRSTGP